MNYDDKNARAEATKRWNPSTGSKLTNSRRDMNDEFVAGAQWATRGADNVRSNNYQLIADALLVSDAPDYVCREVARSLAAKIDDFSVQGFLFYCGIPERISYER